jgi:hypothetical protein
MHLVITIKSDPDGAYLVDSPAPAKGDWLESFKHGVALKKKVPPLLVRTDPDHGSKFKDAIPNQGSDFVISPRFADALASAGVTNVQNFPVTVTDFASRKKHDYFVCNVVGLIPCLDRDKADIKWAKKDPTKIFILRRLAIDEAAIDKFNAALPARERLKLFRLAEYTSFVVVSEDVAKAVQKAGVEGVEFRKPKDCGDFL